MSLPSGVTKIGNIRGPQGLPGTFGGATVAMIPAGETPTVAVRTVGGVSFADFLLPRGLPGVNAVPADNAVATYATGSGTATNTALRSFLLPRAETDATVAALASSGSSALRPALTSFLLPRAETASTVAGLIGSAGVVRDALRAGFVRAGTSTVGSITSPAIELVGNSGSASTLHISSGSGFSGPYLLGVGNDSGTSPGLLVSNKAAGVGFYLDNQSTATGTGMFAAQNSNAPLFDFVTAKNAAGTMMVLRVDSTVSNPGSLAAFYGAGNAPILELHGNGGLGFFGKTPTGRQPRIDFTDASGASLQDRVNKLIGTLINYGLIPA